MTTLSGLLSGSFSEQVTFDQSVIKNIAKLKTLICRTIYSGRYATPRETGQTSGYQVPAGKVFIVVGAILCENGVAANNSLSIGTASNDVGFASSTAPSDREFGSFDPLTQFNSATGTRTTRKTILMRVPAGRYLYFNQSATAASSEAYCLIYGYEVDANAEDI